MDIKKKTLMVIIIIMLFLIIFALLLLLFNNKKKNDPLYGSNYTGDYITIYEENRADNVENIKATLVNDATSYYTVQAIIKDLNIYISYLNPNLESLEFVKSDNDDDEEVMEEYIDEGLEAINDMLANEYKQKYTVDDNYIENNLKKFANKKYEIESMYVVEDSPYINTFFVYGSYENEKYDFLIVLDAYNQAFEIYLDNYMKENNFSSLNIDSMKSIHASAIEQKDYNDFTYKNVEKGIIISDYYNRYIDLLKNDISKAYMMLDDEYRKERFPNIDSFREYVNDVILSKDANIKTYKCNKNESYDEYVCKDEFGRTYIFRTTSINQYKVILDTYTVPIYAYTKEYENFSDVNKAQMCVSVFFECINNRDYSKAYKYLNDEFKQKNFKDSDALKMYADSSWYKNNIYTFDSVENTGNVYIFYGTLREEGNDNSDVLSQVILVRCGSNYNDFELSFEK